VFCNFTLFCTGLLLGDHPATQKGPVKHDILSDNTQYLCKPKMNDKYTIQKFLEQQTGIWLRNLNTPRYTIWVIESTI